jgi:hypothetical protein
MTQIVSSRFQYARRTRKVHSFLRRLDVPYRDGDHFWKDNHHQLRELYEAMKDAARERMVELHPDRGGHGQDFARFIADYRAAQKSFSLHLASAPPSSSTIKFTPIEQVRRDIKAAQARARRRKNKKAFRAYRRELYHRKRAAGWRPTGSAERAKRWRKRHPIKSKRINKRYRAANMDKVRAWKRASYHRQKAAGTLPKRKHSEKKRLIKGSPEWEARQKWKKAYDKRRRRHINAVRRKRYKLKHRQRESVHSSVTFSRSFPDRTKCDAPATT